MLLILKIIGLQEVTDKVRARTDVPYYSFFDYNINRITIENNDNNEKKANLYTNHRNMYWSINYLRILQMLTKHKSHRIMLLVQYKSAVGLIALFLMRYLLIFIILGNFEKIVKNITSYFRAICT
jgi:hypothetical protein